MRILSILMLVAAPTIASAEGSNTMSIQVTSSAFQHNQPIPSEYTCDGDGTSPPLAWSNVPPNTKSIAILVDDPDAPGGTFTHWLVTGISPNTTTLPPGGHAPAGAVEMKNDFGKPGYGPPCPPSGSHHYHFHVYALDTTLPRSMNRSSFLSAIRGHVLAEGDLVGTYRKQRGR